MSVDDEYVTKNIVIRVRETTTYRRLVELAGDETPGGLSWAASRALDEWAARLGSPENTESE